MQPDLLNLGLYGLDTLKECIDLIVSIIPGHGFAEMIYLICSTLNQVCIIKYQRIMTIVNVCVLLVPQSYL